MIYIYIVQFFHGDKLTRLQPRKQLIAILLKRIAIFFFLICFAPCKGIQHSLRFWIPRRGFHRDSSHFQWILYSGFQSYVGFRIPSAACIPNSTSLISRIPESRIALYMWRFVKHVSMFLTTHSSVTKHDKIILENCLNLYQPREDLHYAI